MNNLPYIKRKTEVPEGTVDLLERRLKEIPLNSNALESGVAWSTAGYDLQSIPLHLTKPLASLMKTVNEVCSIVYGECTIEDSTSYITRSWTNKHLKTGQSVEHDHKGAELVFACYASVPENSGNFEMHYGGEWHEVEVSTGDVLVFPAHILHRSQVSYSEEPRYVITLNLNKGMVDAQHKMRDCFNGNDGNTLDVLRQMFMHGATQNASTCLEIENRLISLE